MTVRQALPLALIAFFFIATAYAAQEYEPFFASIMGETGLLGPLLYIVVTILATVVPPVSSLPLIPLASNLWGPLATAIASIVGWFVGAIAAFGLSRKYGRPLAEKMVSGERLDSIEKRLSRRSLFWSIVFLQIALPVDILSYGLGLLKGVSWRVYIPATLIGIIPFAFVFAYAGALPWQYQIPLMAVVFAYIILLNRRPEPTPPPSQRTDGSG